MATEPPVNSLPALSNGFISFGCLNNFAKINTPVMAAWARILKAVEGSRLLVLTPEGNARQRFTEGMAGLGIDLQRLTFASKCPRAAYLESYHQVDISLDPFPYNGHTTSLDSLWMGVPVVTLAGWNAAGRIGLSHAANLQMNELVAAGVDEYVRIAAALAGDQARVAAMRRNLRPRMEMSPLMDAPRFARNMEAAYRRMWRAWCAR
jgi:predicted O-linked N-acetylglucosamine transferase (SPINDLY family)